jgi:glycosyltransferase involved in cell wall biosynthesis
VVSIICPIFNEEKYIAKCLDSILSQDYPLNDMEVLFIDGNSTDKTVSIIDEYKNKYPFIKIISNRDKVVPVAMNLGINAAKGDVIVRLDAHAVYPSNYVSVLAQKLIELGADNVGSILKTDVLNKNGKSLAIKEILSSKLGVGNSIFRTGVNTIQEVDTVPFGCWKRDVFKKYGLFDIKLTRGQDLEFNKRIKRGGGKIYIVPDTYIGYFARETFGDLARQYYKTGASSVLTIFYTRKLDSISIHHYVPFAFILFLILPLLFLPFSLCFIYITIVSLSIYISLVIFFSLFLALKKRLNFIYLVFGFIVIHFSRGFGFLVTLLKMMLSPAKMKK